MVFLIAHKVRGEPALDIAVQMEMADGTWWIIPTSGHRAYPFWFEEMTKMIDTASIFATMPSDLRDHYAIMESPRPPISRTPAKQIIPTLDQI